MYDEYVEHPSFVSLLQFEPSTACDGACTFCHHPNLKRKGTATWSTLLEIIDSCAPYASTACPFIMGEPILEPRLIPILDNLKQVNPKINTHIYTNFYSMDKQKARDIIESQVLDSISVSFYGPTPELYAKYQPGFKWEQTRSNIKQFMQIREKLGLVKPTVQMHYIGLPDLLHYYPTFEAEWNSIVDHVGVTVYRTQSLEEETETQRWMPLVHGKHAPMRVPCSRIWGGFYVHFNGDVVPCCGDYEAEHVLGNIHDVYHPSDIWWGDKAKAFRQLHIDQKWRDIPMCSKCNYWKYEMPKDWVQYWLNRYAGKTEPLPLATVKC
jgi:radical SAM protein with 4Fe4S-binding SPASM domain